MEEFHQKLRFLHVWQLLRRKLQSRDSIFTNRTIDINYFFFHLKTESSDHLFLHCHTSKNIWTALGINVNANNNVIVWLKATEQNDQSYSKYLIILYHIWKARYHMIFRNTYPNTSKIAYSAALLTCLMSILLKNSKLIIQERKMIILSFGKDPRWMHQTKFWWFC